MDETLRLGIWHVCIHAFLVKQCLVLVLLLLIPPQ
jgi:hypothetical protein